MKKHGIVAALAASACVAAHAQSSVTLYGLIDTNLEYLSHASANGSSVIQENSGGLSNSRFGFKGNEDLGGGNAAFFQLEAGFNGNDGTAATAGTLFNRMAAVGLSNAKLGALSVGLQYTAMYDTLIKYDPMAFGQQYTWFPTTGSSADFAFKARVNNSVKYVGQYGPFNLIGEYSFGNDSASFQSSSAWGAALEYVLNGFAAAFAYDSRNGAINTAGMWSRTHNWSASARQAIGPFTLMGGYEHYVSNPTKGASVLSAMWFGGLHYQATDALRLTGAYYYQVNTAANVSNAWMTVLMADYFLSKRTDLYTTLAYAKATRYANGSYTPVGLTDDTAFLDNQTGVTVGIRHRF